MPRRAPLPPGTDPREHPALKGGHVVILGGENPVAPTTGPAGHTALGGILEQKGLDYEPVHGKYQGDKQPAYIVHVRNDSEDEVLKGIARRMGQESVVHSEGGKHQLVYLNGENKGKATAPTSGLEWYGDNEPDDNYTTLYGASGEPLGHFQYTMDFNSPMVPDGPGPMVDVPEAARQVLKSAVESYRGILLDLRKRETERLERMQPLEKPPVSESQRRLVHARANAGEAWAKEWSAADKPGKLPEHKKSEQEPKATRCGPCSGYGNVTAQGADGHAEQRTCAHCKGTGKATETQKAEWKPTPNLMPVRDQHTGSHPDGSSLSSNKPSHPFSEPSRATTGGAIDGRIAKYMVEGGRKGKVRGNKLHSDISTQGPNGPSAPFSTNVVASEAKTHKTEGDYQHIAGIRRREHEELSSIPWRDPDAKPWPKDDGRPVPSLAEERAAAQTRKTETPMKLHDLMKAQAQKPSLAPAKLGSVEHTLFEESDPKVLHPSDKKKAVKKDEFPTTNKFSNKLAAGRAAPTEGSQVNTETSPFKKPDFKPIGTALKAEESMDKAQCTCGQPGCKWCGKDKPKQGNEQGEHGGGPKKPSYQPGDEGRKNVFQGPNGASRESTRYHMEKAEDMPMAPVVKNSIFKKMPEMSKAETIAHATAKRNGGIIKLGKQEFYIDHQNPTAPQKDDPSSSIPGGKETGWRNGGDKPKVIEHSASGGAISGNKPKAGPDQKNTSENSVTEGIVPKSSGKNDLIEKAAADFHKRTGGRFEKASSFGGKFKPSAGDPRKPSTPSKPVDEESWYKEGEKMGKAAPSMGAPKAPSAAGAGSPTLSGGAPSKPPTAHASANPKAFGKALGDFGSSSTRGTPGAGQKPSFDASIVPPGTGASPLGAMTGPAIPKTPAAAPGGFRSPAQHKGVTGFLGKGELCKNCGKSHALGKCA